MRCSRHIAAIAAAIAGAAVFSAAACVPRRDREPGPDASSAAPAAARAAQLAAGAAAGAAPGATAAASTEPEAPGPNDICPATGPGPGFKERPPEDSATTTGEGTAMPEDGRFVVASYNLWELYDGRDGDKYFGKDDHPESATLDEAHVAKRVQALAQPLAGLDADVFVFQEVENADVACAVARAADPASSWSCWAGIWAHEPHPQNVAVAARVPGSLVQLDPGRGMGQRGVLEFAPEGVPLRIAAVHLKSSVGASGVRDCGNAAKRMAVAWGLRARQQALAGPAYLVIGDFNVDPADPEKVGYDRTDDILLEAGDEDLLSRFPEAVALAASGRFHTVIDRAFLRPGGGLAVDRLWFAGAPLEGWASDHRPLVVALRAE